MLDLDANDVEAQRELRSLGPGKKG